MLLPSGNILVVCSGGSSSTKGFGGTPVYWYEYNNTGYYLQPTPPSIASNYEPYYYNMIVLPTGQILQTTGWNRFTIYTPDDTTTYNEAWRPVITNCPTTVFPGGIYKISGILFNGMSQAGMFGNDFQGATNYPLLLLSRLLNYFFLIKF